VGLLDAAAGGRGALTGGLLSHLLPRRLASSGDASSLLGTSHS
jgi:hypothetical protein